VQEPIADSDALAGALDEGGIAREAAALV